MIATMKKLKKATDDMGSTIRLPKEIWDAVDADATRCVRSRNGQVEAILKTYYQLDNVELSDVSASRSRVSPHLPGKDRWTVPVVEANLNDKEKESDTSGTKKRKVR